MVLIQVELFAGSAVFAIADGKFGSAATGFADPVGYVIGVGDRNDDNGPYDANSPDYFAETETAREQVQESISSST